MTRFYPSAVFERLCKYPVDFAGLGLILIFSPIVYLYGIFYLIPTVFNASSQLIQFLAYLFATWCAFGIWTNLYLIRHRKSSIQGRFLPQPVVATGFDQNSSPFEAADGLHHRRINEISKTLGQQFMAKPFGSDEAWHICSTCEVYVPSKCWHCSKGCNTCILRRDHHCVFAMTCIGEENHSNFLGLALYLSLGTTYANVLFMIESSNYFGISYWWYLFRTFIPTVFIFIDFSLYYFLCSLCMLGSLVSAVMFVVYFLGAAKGQTSVERKRGFFSGGSSYRKLESFLGPNPIWRLFWPFHSIYRGDYQK